MRRIAAAVVAGVLGLGACGPAPSPGPSGSAAPSASAAAGATPSPGAAAGVDLVLHSGHVLTLAGSVPVADALAVDGGRITAVGTTDAIAPLAGHSTRIIDLQGLTVVPGFIDAHEHRIVNGPNVTGRPAEQLVREAVEQGYTTIDELYLDPSWVDEFTSLDAAGKLPLRVNVYPAVNENSPEGRLHGEYFNDWGPGELLSPRVRVAGLKVFTDFDNATIMLWEQDDLNKYVLARYREGWQLAIKTVSTRSLDMILEAVGAAAAADASNDVRATRLEHMLFATPDQIIRLAELGIVPVINLNVPGQVVGDAAIDELIAGEPEGSYVPWRSLFEAGIEPAGMSGYPSYYVDEPTGAPFGSPIHMLWQAVTRAGNLGVRSPDSLLGEAISPEQALRTLTINAAIASGEGDTKGSLEAGKLADLVVLSANPLEVEVEAINDIRTLIVIVDGAIEWCAPEVTPLCEGHVGEATPAPATPAPPPPSTSGAGYTITASRSLPENPPELAADLNPETAWVSGDDAEQWIQVELDAPMRIGRVLAQVTQTPAGPTTHELWLGNSPDDLVRVDVLSGETEEGDELLFEVPEPAAVTVLRIVTTKSPSWVAWREILLVPASP